MHAGDVAVTTITWARSPSEGIVLRRSLERLAALGFPVAVADAGTDTAFSTFAGALPRFTVVIPKERGLVSQVRASLALAATFDRPFILYTEPDKERFFEQQLAEFIRRAPGGRGTGVVVATRSDEALSTFPTMQRYTEGVINHLAGDVLGVAGDYSYGPFLIARDLVPPLLGLDSDLGWGWRHAAFASAIARGRQIHHVTGDYVCPPDQREESDVERVHRLRQLSENVRGLIAQTIADVPSGPRQP